MQELRDSKKTRLANFIKEDYLMTMGDFEKGMNSIGQLMPAPSPYADYPPRESAREGVTKSFRQAGDSIRHAIKEFSDAKRENKQTT